MSADSLYADRVQLVMEKNEGAAYGDDEEAVVPGTMPKSPDTMTIASPPTNQSGMREESWTQLKNLQQLYESGFITVTEYKERKSQIVDTLTGTRSVSSSRPKRTRFNDAAAYTVVNKPPPDFTGFPIENAIKYTFDIKHGSWSQRRVQIKIAAEPFARGGLRKAYHMLDLDAAKESPDITYVAKMAIDPYEDREIYFQDVEMQMYAREWAEKFNSYHPPKRVEFIQAWLIELVDRPGKPICGVERFIDGAYRKHNNNFGYVSDDERNTPQAFSHFTYEASGKVLLICDIQGVNDLYTDPQIHNREGIGFGKGNMGERGFERFLATHRCNHICRYLKLPSINAKVIDAGTRAPTTIMQYRKVDVVNVHMPAPAPASAVALSGVPAFQRPARPYDQAGAPGTGVLPPTTSGTGGGVVAHQAGTARGYSPYRAHLEQTSLMSGGDPRQTTAVGPPHSTAECCCILS